MRQNAIVIVVMTILESHLTIPQLIGEEKKYVFLEQALLERLKPVLDGTLKVCRDRIQRLEEEVKQLRSEVNSARLTSDTPGSLQSCPGASLCPIARLTCPLFFMNPNTLHQAESDRFLSLDMLTLSNRRIPGTGDWPRGSAELVKYEGVKGSRVIRSPDKIYFETEINYQIFADLSSTNLVFEVAIATEEAISKSLYVGKQQGAWSVNAHHKAGKVTLFCKSGEVSSPYVLHEESLSSSTSGSSATLVLGFFVNTEDGTFTVIDRVQNRKIYTFTNVDSSAGLWPVFAVFYESKTLASVRLKAPQDLNKVPCNLM